MVYTPSSLQQANFSKSTHIDEDMNNIRYDEDKIS